LAAFDAWLAGEAVATTAPKASSSARNEALSRLASLARLRLAEAADYRY